MRSSYKRIPKITKFPPGKTDFSKITQFIQVEIDIPKVKVILFFFLEYNTMKYNISFKGGGVKGFAYLGCLQYMEENMILSEIESVSGSSVGSVYAFMIASKLSFIDIESIVYETNFSNIINKPSSILGYYRMFRHLIRCWSLYSNHNMKVCIKEIIIKSTSNESITFEQLYEKTKVKLYITGSNISSMKFL